MFKGIVRISLMQEWGFPGGSMVNNLSAKKETQVSYLGWVDPLASLIFVNSSVAQLCLTLCNPWISACQVSLSITNSWSLLKLLCIESVMPYNHLILWHPLLFPPLILPSIRVFSNESVLHIRWPKY